jgi:hypothetical protein
VRVFFDDNFLFFFIIFHSTWRTPFTNSSSLHCISRLGGVVSFFLLLLIHPDGKAGGFGWRAVSARVPLRPAITP